MKRLLSLFTLSLLLFACDPSGDSVGNLPGNSGDSSDDYAYEISGNIYYADPVNGDDSNS
jgi:hypothetical protein